MLSGKISELPLFEIKIGQWALKREVQFSSKMKSVLFVLVEVETAFFILTSFMKLVKILAFETLRTDYDIICLNLDWKCHYFQFLSVLKLVAFVFHGLCEQWKFIDILSSRPMCCNSSVLFTGWSSWRRSCNTESRNIRHQKTKFHLPHTRCLCLLHS